MCEGITSAEIILILTQILSVIIICAVLMRCTKLESDLGRMIDSNRFLRDQINRDQAILEPLRKFHEE